MFEERADFDAYVEATYEFLNPTDDDITATLAFPFGNKPHHLKDVTFADTTRRITIGGREVDNALRCTFKSPYEPFDLENDIANLRDEYIFYNTFPAADTTVYVQTYRVNAPDGAADTHLKLNIQAKDKVIFAVSDRKNVTFKLADDLFEITLNSASCDIVMYSLDKDIDFRRSLWAFDSDRKYVSGSSFAAVDEQHEITLPPPCRKCNPRRRRTRLLTGTMSPPNIFVTVTFLGVLVRLLRTACMSPKNTCCNGLCTNFPYREAQR